MTMRLQSATVRFGAVTALEDASIDIQPGVVTAVIGPNAAGKSTLLRVLAGLQRLRSGVVSIDGTDLASMPDRDRARRIGFLAQRGGVSGPFLTREVVGFGGFALASGRRGFHGVDAAIDAVGLTADADRPLNQLSIGQQQRAGLARALVQVDPAAGGLLLLDEPFSAQDPREIERIAAILKAFAAAGGGVVAAMHEVGVAWSVADHAVLLAGGAVIDAGEIESVLSHRALESLFGTRFVPSEHGPVPASRRRNDASAPADG
ncbi:MAG: ABC transporter ATP-binding protein [Phycisphaeraceae bacterium]|nr:ABC transporter ATP-binding protein [Phycisphaeraceae bacterium]